MVTVFRTGRVISYYYYYYCYGFKLYFMVITYHSTKTIIITRSRGLLFSLKLSMFLFLCIWDNNHLEKSVPYFDFKLTDHEEGRAIILSSCLVIEIEKANYDSLSADKKAYDNARIKKQKLRN
ncbi:hypothetical protein BDC45DRAFT_531390 [Circinella umbellata]|nr:hypothetical protein BDC45DRAFT_531390 [Circinella umbellata]